MPRAEATRVALLPGSAAAARLFKCSGAAAACQWQAHLDAYTCAVATVGTHRKKRKQLGEWNEFLAVELPQISRKRGATHTRTRAYTHLHMDADDLCVCV